MSFKLLYQQSPPELKKIVIDQWKAKQNPKYHPEGNTLKHIIIVTDRAFRDFPNNKDIQLAAYFHDLGKLSTYDINPKTGQPTAYQHEKESVNLINKFDSFIKQQGADPEIVKYIVQNHMRIKPSTWDVMKTSKKDPIINDPNYQNLEKFSTIDKGGIPEEFKRMQKLAGIVTETVDKTLETKLGLLLKDPSIKTSIDSLIKDMPAEPKGSTMTKLSDDKIHITLTSIKSSKPFKDKLKDFQLPEDIKFPNVELGNAEFVYREDGKITYVAAVKNQNDIKEFVDKIYQKIGETNPEPNRFFHITLANNQGGDPFKSIGNVEKSDLIK